MNTTKTVFNKLYSKKTELESHKVELGLVQDILKEYQNAKSKGKAMKKFANEVDQKNNELDKLETLYNKTIKEHKESIENFEFNRNDIIAIYNRASENYKKLVNNASDLGIDVPSNVEKSFKEIDDLFNFQKNAYAKNTTSKRKEI